MSPWPAHLHDTSRIDQSAAAMACPRRHRGSYVLMDGGLRDARGAGGGVDMAALDAERTRHMVAGMQRRRVQQPLIDER